MSGDELAVRAGLELAARQLETVAERVVSPLVYEQASRPADYEQLTHSR